MKSLKQPRPDTLLASIRASVKNGERLLDESYDLEFRDPSSSRYFLVMIAQEEFSKAFILYMVLEGIVAFSPPILRAINDHACKQLVSVILDYMIMHWEEVEEMQAAVRLDHDLGDRLPYEVVSAMDLLRYEKIGHWEGIGWVWCQDSGHDPSTRRIADGKKDSHKQDALYVRIGRDGRVASTPDKIIASETQEEFSRAGRYRSFMSSLIEKQQQIYRYDKAMTALKQLFTHQG